MKWFDEFYDKNICINLAERMKKYKINATLMEVCGTHTMSVARNGIRSILPENIELLSGPGCPVCVTPDNIIDETIALSQLENVCITTYGDMMRVPGSYSSFEKERAKGRDIRVVYSAYDALEIAKQINKKVIFIGVGFETTAPSIAATIYDAKKEKIKNYYVLSAHKLIPPAIKAILDSGEVKIDGFLLPGHVSTIIGRKIYEFIANDYKVACAITGFEPTDILYGIISILEQLKNGEPKVDNCYKRSVREDGNLLAKKLMYEVFSVCDSDWRGLGVIPDSGLKIKDEYKEFDANDLIKYAPKNTNYELRSTIYKKYCSCGDVLRGVKKPTDCKLFKKVCTPENPIGPCMVSSEGTCAAYYKYGTY